MKFLMPMGGWIHTGGALREPVHLGLLFVKEEMDTSTRCQCPRPCHRLLEEPGRIRELSFGIGGLAGGALLGKLLPLLTPGLHSEATSSERSLSGQSRQKESCITLQLLTCLYFSSWYTLSLAVLCIELFVISPPPPQLERELRESGRVCLVPLPRIVPGTNSTIFCGMNE